MKLNITGRQMEVTKGILQYARKRFGKLSVFLGANAEVHVILKVEGYRHLAEVTAQSGPYAIAAKQITKDMYSAIDLVAEKALQQLSRQHDKLARKSVAAEMPPAKEAVRAAGARKEAPAAGRIVEVEPAGGKPMTQEEAALQMGSSRLAFMVFEDVHSGELNVLVRRKDGNFKLIVKD